MPPIRGPAVPRRRLGTELRRLRENAGLLIEDVATELECSTSKISRLETGKGIPKVRDIRDMLDMYAVDDRVLRDRMLRWARQGQQQGWWHHYVDVLQEETPVPVHLDTYIAFESDASAYLTFQTTLMPGLLQTAAYARAVIESLAFRYNARDVDRLVEVRMRRQQILSRAEAPLRLHAVIDEAVLSRPIGDHQVMQDQLQALTRAAEQPSITVQVLPFAVGLHQGLVGSFELLEFSDAEDHDLLCVEKLTGNSYSEADEEIMRYRQAFRDVCKKALDPARSTAFIEAALGNKYR